jgi:hypothetical protein
LLRLAPGLTPIASVLFFNELLTQDTSRISSRRAGKLESGLTRHKSRAALGQFLQGGGSGLQISQRQPDDERDSTAVRGIGEQVSLLFKPTAHSRFIHIVDFDRKVCPRNALDDRGILQCLGDGVGIGTHQAAGAQLDAAVVAHNGSQHAVQVVMPQYLQDRASCRAGRFAIVRHPGLAAGQKRPADMRRAAMLLAQRLEFTHCGIAVFHRNDKSDEAAFPDFDVRLDGRRKGGCGQVVNMQAMSLLRRQCNSRERSGIHARGQGAGIDFSLYCRLRRCPHSFTIADSKVTSSVIRQAIFSAAMGLAILTSATAAEPLQAQALPAKKSGTERIDPVQAALEELKASPGAMSAVRLLRGNGAPFCTIGTEVDRNIFVDNDRAAVMYSPEFRVWHGRGNVTRYTEVRSNARELFVAMMTTRCQIVVESAANIVAIVNELDQEGMAFSILPSPLQPAQLAEAFAASLGFGSHADLMLAAHMMASNEELQAYFRFGVRSTADYDDAFARMQSQGYSQDRLQLLAFLADEAEGARRNLAPSAIRDERHAQALAPSR